MHPQFDPVAIWLGPLPVRWYGLMYLLAFISFILMGKVQLKNNFRFRGVYKKDIEDLMIYGIFGVVFGGRLGYIFFYKPFYYFNNPLEIFAVWQGGMSFHGGLIGVILALLLFTNNRPKFGRRVIKHINRANFFTRFLMVSDFVAPLVPLGLMFGRIGNFINGELYGRIADPNIIFWAMIFPQSGSLDPRHPSQLYQALGEGIFLFFILLFVSKFKPKLGVLSSSFLIGYGILRFITEYFREPDPFLGFVLINLSIGQLLCLPMIFFGVLLYYFSSSKHGR
ncbi:MAG: prolipoprotein diacylglyceryl transferase [Betaproteobacteria bacterium TMED156]|nr:MAG: prolipoprotein diacylglyceryl transferase [Betaproteobacteria bacterium TMED156]|tara:strand:+ start:1463 stop:2305 length:843 start_codon:yes stop_codon:yes gene_type:complete